jgi:hypothetical protein
LKDDEGVVMVESRAANVAEAAGGFRNFSEEAEEKIKKSRKSRLCKSEKEIVPTTAIELFEIQFITFTEDPYGKEKNRNRIRCSQTRIKERDKVTLSKIVGWRTM